MLMLVNVTVPHRFQSLLWQKCFLWYSSATAAFRGEHLVLPHLSFIRSQGHAPSCLPTDRAQPPTWVKKSHSNAHQNEPMRPSTCVNYRLVWSGKLSSLLWNMCWPLSHSDRFPADLAQIDQSQPFIEYWVFLSDDCTEECSFWALSEHLHKQPRWLPLPHMPVDNAPRKSVSVTGLIHIWESIVQCQTGSIQNALWNQLDGASQSWYRLVNCQILI